MSKTQGQCDFFFFFNQLLNVELREIQNVPGFLKVLLCDPSDTLEQYKGNRTKQWIQVKISFQHNKPLQGLVP